MPGNLILVPTEVERQIIESHLRWSDSVFNDRIELCGFGMVAAAVCSMQWIAKHAPERVILVGIAGSLRADCKVGMAYAFGSVTCDGIGIGTEESYQSASELGWAFISDSPSITETIVFEDSRLGSLLSVCAGSVSPAQASVRSRRYQNAAAEDMEGYAVALACQITKKPLSIVRGISNSAGDRNHSGWQIDNALRSAAFIVNQLRGFQT